MANRYSRIFHHISINDVKKNREIVIERKRVQENKEMEEKNYIDERMENKKSNWRESFTNVTVGMKVGQTFSIGGVNITTGGALGGVESVPTSVDILGDQIPGPSESQYGLQGYAKPLNFMRRKDPEDTNKKLDASQEFAKKVNADVMMNARVKSDGKSTKTSRTIKAAETLIKYLRNKLPKGKWNDYLGKGYVDYAIRKGKLLSNGGVSVGDNVIGSAGSITFDSQSGKYRMNFKGLGVDDNITQFSKGEYSIFSKALYNLLGKYSADLMPNLPWLAPLSLAIGKQASDVLQVAKLFGGGKDVDAFIEFSPEELFSKNPQLAQDYMLQNFGLTGSVWSPRMMGSPQGSNPSVTHNYYALYGKLPPSSVVKGSVPFNFGDYPEYDPAVIAKIDKMKKFLRSQGVRPPIKSSKAVNSIKSMSKTRGQSLSLDEPIVRRKKKNNLKEQPAFKAVPISSTGMNSSQDFAMFTNIGGLNNDTGVRFTLDGLGGTESLPIFNYPLEAGGSVKAIDVFANGQNNSVQIDLRNFGLQGRTIPLGSTINRRLNKKKEEDMNKQLNSSENFTKKINADEFMKARVTNVRIDKAALEKQKADEKFLDKQQTIVNLTKGFGMIGLPNDFAQWTLNYAKGNLKPITKFSRSMTNQVRDLVLDKFAASPSGTETVSITYGDYGGNPFSKISTKLGLGRFTATKLPNGDLRITDTFNVDKTATHIGSARMIPGLQDTANRLVNIAHERRGITGNYDEGGIPINVVIKNSGRFAADAEHNKNRRSAQRGKYYSGFR